jgi:hypothetical protein
MLYGFDRRHHQDRVKARMAPYTASEADFSVVVIDVCFTPEGQRAVDLCEQQRS